MSIVSRGILKGSYISLGEFALRYVVILASEDESFIFLSEDENDVLISEEFKPVDGMLKSSYIQKGTFETEEL